METNEIKNEIIKATVPAGVTMTSVLGVALSDWVYLATIVYIILQCLCLVYKTFFKKREKERC